jgi:hypothetical protein
MAREAGFNLNFRITGSNEALDRLVEYVRADERALTAPVQEPESFEQWNAKQHGDPEEIGFLQALRIAYCSGQDSVMKATPPAQPAPVQEKWGLSAVMNPDYVAAQKEKAQKALDVMAENARELGLDYEPVPENFIDALKFDVAMRDAAPVQEPVALTYKEVADAMNALWGGTLEQVKIAMEMADKKLYTTTPAQPAVPDAIHHTDTSETLEYIQGWNDCRAETLKMRKP